MNKNTDPAKKTISYQAHKQEYIWQILVPILTASALVLLAVIAISSDSSGTVSVWADISAIWIIMPLLLVGGIVFFTLGLLIYGMANLLDIMPKYTQSLNGFVRRASMKITGMADLSTKPIFFVGTISAKITSIFSKK